MSAFKVVLFFGSVREGRLGFRLAKFMEGALTQKNLAVTLFDPDVMNFPLMKKNVNMYGANFSSAPQWLQDAYAKVVEADAYVVVSAEYNHSIPPALSNMMDYFPIPSFKHKPCSIITYSYGRYGGVRAAMQLRSFLGELGMVTPHFIFAVPEVHLAFTEGGEPLQDEMTTGAEKSIGELLWYTRALKREREQGLPK